MPQDRSSHGCGPLEAGSAALAGAPSEGQRGWGGSLQCAPGSLPLLGTSALGSAWFPNAAPRSCPRRARLRSPVELSWGTRRLNPTHPGVPFANGTACASLPSMGQAEGVPGPAGTWLGIETSAQALAPAPELPMGLPWKGAPRGLHRGLPQAAGSWAPGSKLSGFPGALPSFHGHNHILTSLITAAMTPFLNEVPFAGGEHPNPGGLGGLSSALNALSQSPTLNPPWVRLKCLLGCGQHPTPRLAWGQVLGVRTALQGTAGAGGRWFLGCRGLVGCPRKKEPRGRGLWGPATWDLGCSRLHSKGD